jgi:hypothetical protein
MSEPIDSDKISLSIGGYEVIAGGKNYQFDFSRSYGFINEKEPDVITFQLRDEAIDEFPEIAELKEHLHEITAMTECYVHIEPEDDPIEVKEILGFRFSLYEDKKRESYPESTESVICTYYEGETDCTIDFDLTKKVLQEIPLP